MGPYGITQVDVPGALNALEAARSNRIRQMLLQRQLQQEERAFETQRGMRGAISRYLNPDQAAAAPAEGALDATGMGQPATPSAGGVAGAVDMYGAPDAATAAPAVPGVTAPPAAAPPAPGPGDLNRLSAELLAIDPEQAVPIIAAFRAMDEAQFTAAQRRNQTLARAAYTLLALPEAERSAEFQRIAPDLIANGGVTRQQLAGFELTEANLRHVINQSRDVEKLAEEARPQLRNVEAGAVIIDERNPGAGPVYESPYVRGADGTLYRREGAPAARTTGGGTTTATGDFDHNAAASLGASFGTVTSTVRTPEHNREVGGVPNSFHLERNGGRAIDIARRRGVSHSQIVEGYRRAGYALHPDTRDEGDHSHIVIASGPRGGNQPARVASRAEYDRLPSGAQYVAPDGTVRRKP